MEGERSTFEAVRARLDEIVDAVNAEDVTLDEALALYEEAVKLGLSACDLSEKDVEAAFPADFADDAAAEVAEAVEGAGSAGPAAPAESAEGVEDHSAPVPAASEDGRLASQD